METGWPLTCKFHQNLLWGRHLNTQLFCFMASCQLIFYVVLIWCLSEFLQKHALWSNFWCKHLIWQFVQWCSLHNLCCFIFFFIILIEDKDFHVWCWVHIRWLFVFVLLEGMAFVKSNFFVTLQLYGFQLELLQNQLFCWSFIH